MTCFANGVSVLLAIIILAVGVRSPAMATDPFCALTVRVVDVEGLRVNRAKVSLIGPMGSIEKDTEGDTVTFCDFGFGMHEVVLGRGSCNERRVPNVQIMFGVEQVLHILRDRCPPNWVPDSCRAWIRFVDETGNGVPGVEVIHRSSGVLVTDPSDKFGRMKFGIGRNTRLNLEYRAPGGQHGQLDLRCDAHEINKLEVVVPAQ